MTRYLSLADEYTHSRFCYGFPADIRIGDDAFCFQITFTGPGKGILSTGKRKM